MYFCSRKIKMKNFRYIEKIVLKRIILFIALFVACTAVFSQRRIMRPENLPLVDEKLIHFGFTLGMHTQKFQIESSYVRDANDILWHAELAPLTPGFTVGMITDLRLVDGLNLRFVPTLHFGDRQFVFSGFKDDKKVDEFKANVLSSHLAFPLYLKYRANRVNNYRPYLIAGGGFSLDLSRNKEGTILLNLMDYFIEFGVGCDIYLPYFKLAPEFKMYIGFNDMLDKNRPLILIQDNLKYTYAIQKLLSRLFTLTFNFE